MMTWDGMWGFGWIAMLLFWIFVIAGIVWLVLTIAAPGRRGERSDAHRILEERFARGEIDAEELRARRGALDERQR